MKTRSWRLATCLLLLCLPAITGAQAPAGSDSPAELYNQLKAFQLGTLSAHVENFQFDRDALRLTLTGDVYFSEQVGGVVHGAVFIGQGKIASTPRVLWEEQSVSRFLNAKAVDGTFTKAVLRFTDDTVGKFAAQPAAGDANRAEAQRLATALNERITRESGLNIEARLLQSMVNKEQPGMFFMEAEGGNRGRFGAVLDHQMQIPSSIFGVNGGEKGIIFKYEGPRFGIDVWTAFYSEQDHQQGMASYADAFDQVSIPNYRLDVDLRDPGNWLRMQAQMEIASLADGVRVIPLKLNEGLGEEHNERRNKGVRVLSAELEGKDPDRFPAVG